MGPLASRRPVSCVLAAHDIIRVVEGVQMEPGQRQYDKDVCVLKGLCGKASRGVSVIKTQTYLLYLEEYIFTVLRNGGKLLHVKWYS